MKRIYELTVPINGKNVMFSMDVDESLKPTILIDDATANKWRSRLKAIAYSMFEKEKNDHT